MPNFSNSQATAALEALLAKVAINKTVLATMASNASVSDDPKSGNLPVWIESVRRAGITNVLVAAYDVEALAWLQAHNVSAILRKASGTALPEFVADSWFSQPHLPVELNCGLQRRIGMHAARRG